MYETSENLLNSIKTELQTASISAELQESFKVADVFNALYQPVGSTIPYYIQSVLPKIESLHFFRSSLRQTISKCDEYLSNPDLLESIKTITVIQIKALKLWIEEKLLAIRQFYAKRVALLYQNHCITKNPEKTIRDLLRDPWFKLIPKAPTYRIWCNEHGLPDEQMNENNFIQFRQTLRDYLNFYGITESVFQEFFIDYAHQDGFNGIITWVKGWGIANGMMIQFYQDDDISDCVIRQLKLTSSGKKVLSVEHNIRFIPIYLDQMNTRTQKSYGDTQIIWPGPYMITLKLSCEISQLAPEAPLVFSQGDYHLEIVENKDGNCIEPRDNELPTKITLLIEYLIDYVSETGAYENPPLFTQPFPQQSKTFTDKPSSKISLFWLRRSFYSRKWRRLCERLKSPLDKPSQPMTEPPLLEKIVVDQQRFEQIKNDIQDKHNFFIHINFFARNNTSLKTVLDSFYSLQTLNDLKSWLTKLLNSLNTIQPTIPADQCGLMNSCLTTTKHFIKWIEQCMNIKPKPNR